MRLIYGTYRRKTHIEKCMTSANQHLTGVTEIVFIDDSGDDEHCDWLEQYGRVVRVGGKGYNAAMKAACVAAEGQECMWLEEDFQILEPIDLADATRVLYDRPYLAQVAWLRNSHFPVEHEHGGLLEALEARGEQINLVNGVHEQTATFTANPSVWRGSVWAAGWPTGQWSEDRKRNELLRQGYRFGFFEGVKVDHSGVRSGFGY